MRTKNKTIYFESLVIVPSQLKLSVIIYTGLVFARFTRRVALMDPFSYIRACYLQRVIYHVLTCCRNDFGFFFFYFNSAGTNFQSDRRRQRRRRRGRHHRRKRRWAELHNIGTDNEQRSSADRSENVADRDQHHVLRCRHATRTVHEHLGERSVSITN